MNNIFEFIIKPTPRTGEDILGFVARLGALNGRYNLGRITAVFDIKKVGQSILYPATNEHQVFVERLAKSIKQAPTTLTYAFTSSDDYYPQYRSTSLKICLECCSGRNGYIKANWQSHHVTHCDIHKTPLISSCPHCEKTIKATGDILSGCSHCGFRWEELCLLPVVELPAHQAILGYLSQVEKIDYLSHLYKAYMFIEQQYKVTATKFTPHQYKNVTTAEQFAKAFILIANKPQRKRWLQSKFDHLLNSPKLGLFCQAQLKNLASRIIKRTPCYLSKLESITVKEKLSAYQPDRFISSPPLESYSVPRKDAANLIDLDLKSLNYLIDCQQIKIIESDRNNHINLHHLADYLLKLVDDGKILPSDEKSNRLISIENLKKCLKYFNADLSTLLEVIFKYELNMSYISYGKVASINKVHLDRETIVELLEQEFSSRLKEQISENKFKEIAFINTTQFDALKNIIGLDKNTFRYKQEYLTHQSLRKVFGKYEIINRWSKIHSVKLTHAKEYLKHINSLKRLDIVGQENLIIYEKSIELQRALHQLSKNYTGELPKLVFLYS